MCVFLGFAKDSDACGFLDLGTNSIIEAQDVEFFEDKFIKDKSLSLEDVPENAEKSITLDELISPEAEGTDTEEETPKTVEPPSNASESRTLGMISSHTRRRRFKKLLKK